MRAITRSAVVLLSVLIALGGASAVASAHKHKRRPLVLHPRFHVVGSALAVDTDGPYALLLSVPGVDGVSSGTLIDEQTGTRTTPSYPGCSLNAFSSSLSGPWLMLSSCDRADGGFELYNLYTGEWRTVVPAPAVVRLENECTMPDYCGGAVAGLGAYWIEWSIVPCRYCTAKYLFQNLDTGQVRGLLGWRAGGRIIPNLDSQSLAQRLCPPLTVPSTGPTVLGGPPGPVALSFYGSFAIAGDALLERCGSRLKLAVGNHNGVLANSHAVVWTRGPNSRRLSGLFLPSLRRFVIATPSIPTEYGWALSSGELYVIGASHVGENGRVFATPAPTQSHRRPSAREHH